MFEGIVEQFNELHEEEVKQGLWDSSEKKSPMEIVIKPEALDTTNLDSSDSKKAVWRPSDWNEYIGQSNMKKILKAYIKGSSTLDKQFPHVMVDGKAGTGKTTICYLLAKKLGVPFVEVVATTLQTQQQLVDKIAECNGGILMIDEIQELNPTLCNFLLPILEDFQINGQRIKQFTLFSATTEKGELLKKFKPLVDRQKIQITLEDYEEQDLSTITKQYAQRTFNRKDISDEVLNRIAKNCRYTPRIAIRYLESYIFMGCEIDEVFESYNIVKDGFTKDDMKVLELLSDYEKGVGLQTIASYLGTSEANYLYTNESYLLQKQLIVRLPRGRMISDKGRKFLEELK